jgi:hypothetical protein
MSVVFDINRASVSWGGFVSWAARSKSMMGGAGPFFFGRMGGVVR